MFGKAIRALNNPWGFIAFLGFTAGFGMLVQGLSFGPDFSEEIRTLATLWGFVFAVLIYCKYRSPFFYRLLYGPFALYCTGIIFSVAQCTYANLTAQTFDSTFLMMDRDMGIDWKAMHDWVWSNPALAKTLAYAYSIILSQMAIVSAFVGVKDFKRLKEFLTANVLCIILILFFFGSFPAFGPEHTLGITMSPYLENSFKLYSALRDGQTTISLANTGMVTFPSYHAALAMLTAFVVGSLSPWIKWPIWALQATIVVSTPPMGGHYVVDTIVGIIFACMSIYLAQGLHDAKRN